MRRRFSTATMAAAWRRAGGHCEICTAPIGRGRIHYDHIIADAMRGEPTLANCQVLCLPCHNAKTREVDIPQIAQAKRREARDIGARVSRNPIKGWRKFNGTAVRNPRAYD